MRKGRYGLMHNLTQEYYTMFVEAGLLEPSKDFETKKGIRTPRVPLTLNPTATTAKTATNYTYSNGHKVVEIKFKGHRNKKGIVLGTKYDGQVLKCAIPAEAPYEYEGIYLFNINRWELVSR